MNDVENEWLSHYYAVVSAFEYILLNNVLTHPLVQYIHLKESKPVHILAKEWTNEYYKKIKSDDNELFHKFFVEKSKQLGEQINTKP